MRKMKRWKSVVALVLCVGLLPGCGKTEPVEDTEEEYVVELYGEPATESLAVNEPETEAQPIQAEPPTEETVSDMLGSFLDWSGMCYMLGLGEEFREQDGITPKQMIPMAAHAASCVDVRVTTDDSVGCYVISEDILKEYEENLFGQSCESSEYVLDEVEQSAVDDRGINMRDCIGVAPDGSIYVAMGDWGTGGPKFQVQEISRIDDTNQFQVKVNYFIWYWVEETETFENKLAMLAEYTFEPSEDSDYGYIITDMKYMKPESVSSDN